MSAADAGTFLTGTAVFFVLKLTTSVDDILWLSPFLAIGDDVPAHKIRCCAVYGFVCLLVTVEAFVIAFSASRGVGAVVGAFSDGESGAEDGTDGEDGGGGEGYWNASRILCIFASVCIAGFACKEFREWREEQEEEEEGEGGKGGGGVGKGMVKSEHEHAEDDDEPTVGTTVQPSTPTSEAKGGATARQIAAAAAADDLPHSLFVPDMASVSRSSSIASSKDDGGGYKSLRNRDSTSDFEEVVGDVEDCNDISSYDVEEDEDDEGDSVQTRPLVQVKVRSADDDDECKLSNEEDVNEEEEGGEKERHTLVSLFVVAFFGTLDDLALFSAVLMGKSIHWLSLLCGSMLAAVVIVFASWCMSLCRPFADVMQRIPLWALLFAIALYIFIDGLL